MSRQWRRRGCRTIQYSEAEALYVWTFVTHPVSTRDLPVRPSRLVTNSQQPVQHFQCCTSYTVPSPIFIANGNDISSVGLLAIVNLSILTIWSFSLLNCRTLSFVSPELDRLILNVPHWNNTRLVPHVSLSATHHASIIFSLTPGIQSTGLSSRAFRDFRFLVLISFVNRWPRATF